MGTAARNYFAAIPGRATGDTRLAAVHFRVLMAIAGFDRMSRNGQGCWAGRDKLAELVKCNPTSLSTAIKNLVDWGYLSIERSEVDRRLKGYRVAYDPAADALGIGGQKRSPAGSGDAAETLENSNLSEEDTSANSNLSRQIELQNANLNPGDRFENREKYVGLAENSANKIRDLDPLEDKEYNKKILVEPLYAREVSESRREAIERRVAIAGYGSQQCEPMDLGDLGKITYGSKKCYVHPTRNPELWKQCCRENGRSFPTHSADGGWWISTELVISAYNALTAPPTAKAQAGAQ